ncbi:hypothetical protein L1987_37483 [Smallanthus sonchifolius]|uniref:Uncharacterized protein n=1 Tax=Smallanthus sonchifolius TaxID=185202 RepID=A0ACB9HG21_9ASTR|nr:hypothetical protein L1987_37483 [Smallanthus sonchifolius]
MRECPSQCMKHNSEAQDIECYFFCVLNCEKCPNSPTGCPPGDEETTKKLAEANMNGMEQILIKADQDLLYETSKCYLRLRTTEAYLNKSLNSEITFHMDEG